MPTFLLASALALAARRLPDLHARGNEILGGNSKPVTLRGVNTACMEWSSDGEGHILRTVEVAVEDWHANIIRLPLCEDRWFGKATEQKDEGKSYRALVKQVVGWTTSHGCYILLDMHWSDADVWGQNIGQHEMPDMHTVEFWKACATEYKNAPGVLFDLYNEPHDITWDLWRDGGEVAEVRGPGARQGAFKPVTYRTPGMQSLLDTVRSTGARNMVVAGGLDWAYDLSGFLKGYALKDPKGNGVAYACHAYPNKGESIGKCFSHIDAAIPSIPVIVSEFGDQNLPPRGTPRGTWKDDKPNPWLDAALAEMARRKMSWIAWDLHPAAGPTLVSGWDYAPTYSFGRPVKEALANSVAEPRT